MATQEEIDAARATVLANIAAGSITNVSVDGLSVSSEGSSEQLEAIEKIEEKSAVVTSGLTNAFGMRIRQLVPHGGGG